MWRRGLINVWRESTQKTCQRQGFSIFLNIGPLTPCKLLHLIVIMGDMSLENTEHLMHIDFRDFLDYSSL